MIFSAFYSPKRANSKLGLTINFTSILVRGQELEVKAFLVVDYLLKV